MDRDEVPAEADERDEREADAARDPHLARLRMLLARREDDADEREREPELLPVAGMSPVARPTTIGIVAESPVIGATMEIAPICMPR